MTKKRGLPYQHEPKCLSDGIWQRGWITPWELLQISAWKAANANLASLSTNTEEAIVERTAEVITHLMPLRQFDALAPTPEWQRWQEQASWAIGSDARRTGLLGLAGIGYPVATAVLCILNPRAFPVMDKWAIAALHGPNERPSDHYGATPYRAYAEALVARQSRFPACSTIHEIDQALMNQGRASKT